MRTWIKHWIHRWHGPELALVRRTPQGDGALVTYIDLLTLAAADHCDGELWITETRPHTLESLAATLSRDVIWLRAAMEPLFSVGLLEWMERSLQLILVIVHWEDEQEPLQAVQRRRALAAERNRRYRRRQALQLSQRAPESQTGEVSDGLRLLREFRQRNA